MVFAVSTDHKVKVKGCEKINKYLDLARKGDPRSVMVKVMDCRIVISDFEFQSFYYVHFGTKTLGKGLNLIILLAKG